MSGFCVFDAYGTLFDVNSAARQAANEPGYDALGACWQKVSTDWREKQLQYSWLRAVTGAHADFWQVTKDGLDWALEANGLEDDKTRERLLALYWTLSAYPEVPEVLKGLKMRGWQSAILSNGSPEMLENAVQSAGIGAYLTETLSVESVGVFKPDRRVYDLVGKHFGCKPDAVLFVSANGWDAAAAAGYGFRTAWVNRPEKPIDRLPWHPDHVLSDLLPVLELAARMEIG